MNTGIVIIAVFLAIVFVLAFPTRRRTERAYTLGEGRHPLLRPFLALAARRKARRRKRAVRERHLEVHRD